MKLWIWTNLLRVSERFHENGGAVVVARDEAHARDLIRDFPFLEVEEDEWENARTYELTGEPDSRVFIFPNAGCC